MARTYRRLRLCGEQPLFLRHCLNVHSAEQCSQRAMQLLRLHNRVSALTLQRQDLAWFRIFSKLKLGLQIRGARISMYAIRSRLRILNFVSDVLVVFTFAMVLVVAHQFILLMRVYMQREERIQAVLQPVIDTIYMLEAQGHAASKVEAPKAA